MKTHLEELERIEVEYNIVKPKEVNIVLIWGIIVTISLLLITSVLLNIVYFIR